MKALSPLSKLSKGGFGLFRKGRGAEPADSEAIFVNELVAIGEGAEEREFLGGGIQDEFERGIAPGEP